MATVLLLGTFDTKGAEHAFAARRLAAAGVDVLKVDVGVLDEPTLTPDISAAEVLAADGGDLEELRRAGDRGAAVSAMARAASVVVANLCAEGRIHGALALGGTGGTSIAARAPSPSSRWVSRSSCSARPLPVTPGRTWARPTWC